jgi:hypothetical protein
MIFQAGLPEPAVQVIPAIKGRSGDAQLVERAPDRQVRLLDQVGDMFAPLVPVLER